MTHVKRYLHVNSIANGVRNEASSSGKDAQDGQDQGASFCGEASATVGVTESHFEFEIDFFPPFFVDESVVLLMPDRRSLHNSAANFGGHE